MNNIEGKKKVNEHKQLINLTDQSCILHVYNYDNERC
jgi:hypothetical protein